VTFTPLLVVDDEGATHYGKDLSKAVVKAKLVGEQKGEKVKIFKYRAKTGYAKRQGHRQMYSLVEIEEVSLGKRSPKKAEEPKAEEPKAEEPKAEEPKAEEPKAEEPKAEEPKAEEPKAEE